MASELGMAPNSLMRIWHAFGLQLFRREKWKLSKDPQLIEKVHDRTSRHLRPVPEPARMGGRAGSRRESQIQALENRAEVAGACPGRPSA
jgi:hypothetical protein